MRVLVCGSRTFTHDRAVIAFLDGLACEVGARHLTVIHGGCPSGADSFASRWISQTIARSRIYDAQWEKHGKAAGPIRNQQMLDDAKPELVLAFVDKPLAESKGTADMVRRAQAAGVRTYVVEAR